MSKDPIALVVDDEIPEYTRLRIFRREIERHRRNHAHRMMVQGRRQVDTTPESFRHGRVQVRLRALDDLGLPRASILGDEHLHGDLPIQMHGQERLPEGPDGKGRQDLRLRPIIDPQGLGSQRLRGQAPLLLAESDLLPFAAPEGLLDLLDLGIAPGAALRPHGQHDARQDRDMEDPHRLSFHAADSRQHMAKEGPGERPRIRSPRYVACQRARATSLEGVDSSLRCTYSDLVETACQASPASSFRGGPKGLSPGRTGLSREEKTLTDEEKGISPWARGNDLRHKSF